MRRLVVAVLTTGALSCVPPADEEQPRGAVAIVTVPSKATRGEPFHTADGWTVTIERFALQASFYVETDPRSTDDPGFYGAAPGRFGGEKPIEVLVRAIPAGLGAAKLQPEPGYLESTFGPGFKPQNLGLDPATSERFDRPSENPNEEEYATLRDEYGRKLPGPRMGPSFVLVARGVEDGTGRAVRIDVAMGAHTYTDHAVATQVAANAKTAARIGINAEVAFAADEERPELLTFGDLAAADADADGRITGPELDAVKLECEFVRVEEDNPEEIEECATLAGKLEARLRLVSGEPQK